MGSAEPIEPMLKQALQCLCKHGSKGANSLANFRSSMYSTVPFSQKGTPYFEKLENQLLNSENSSDKNELYLI